MRDTGREQQETLRRVADGIAGQADVMGKLQRDANDLVHLQAVLHQNLAALASASNFEEAVHSLTAAVHLLTARAAGRRTTARRGRRHETAQPTSRSTRSRSWRCCSAPWGRSS